MLVKLIHEKINPILALYETRNRVGVWRVSIDSSSSSQNIYQESIVASGFLVILLVSAKKSWNKIADHDIFTTLTDLS